MTDAPVPPPPPAAAPPPPPSPGGYPVRTELNAPLEVKNWRPLVHGILIIPFAIVAGVIAWVAALCAFIAFFSVLFTKRIPDGIVRFIALGMRVQWRSISYAMFLREPYPPFEFTPSAADPGDDPAVLSIDEPGELNRWLPLVKGFLAIPHVFVLFFLAIAAWFVVAIGFFAVLFTGKWPQGLRDYVVGVMRWGNRVGAYTYFLTDEYPPFSLD